MRPLAYLLTCVIVAALAYGWWMRDTFTTHQVVLFCLAAGVNAVMYGVSLLEIR